MFILKSAETIKRAVEKAKQVKPRVRMVKFGQYEVKGSKGNPYTVLCRRDKQTGMKVVACDCKAGEHGNPCYHAAAAVGLHIVLAEQAQSAFQTATL